MQPRMSADERRDDVIAAAAIEFATGGYAGTSTGMIAKRAGVSQPYLFQLFGTKKELFLAAVRNCFARTGARFEETAAAERTAGVNPIGTLTTMGHAYVELLLADRDLLRLQLHAYAACGDPEVREVVRDEFQALWQSVAGLSGADPEALQAWFANGMLINVIASIGDARTLDEFCATIPRGVVG